MTAPPRFDPLLQRVEQLEREVEELKKRLVVPEAVCCPDCGALPAATRSRVDDMRLIHCGVCGPDKGVCLSLFDDAPYPWQHYWNMYVSEELQRRVREKG